MDAPVDFFEQPQEPESVEEAPEPHANGRGRGRNGRGRGGRQGGNDRGSGSRGKGPNKRATASTCICPNCTAPKYPGSRFCSLFHHKKAWDNMLYQRKTRSITKEQAEAFDERMRIDHEAGKEVARFALDNPPELKKKGLVDFQRFVRIRGQRVATCQQDGTKPYTYAAFIISMPRIMRDCQKKKEKKCGTSSTGTRPSSETIWVGEEPSACGCRFTS